MDERTLARFEAKVDRSGGPDACHIWKAGTNGRAGYGFFYLNGAQVLAHRFAFFIEHGRWPEPFGLHTCDNPPCVNSGHIYEGDNSRNLLDAFAKGRGRNPRLPGERHGRAKLDEFAVREIIRLRPTTKLLDLAGKFGVGVTTVRHILSGKNWKHLRLA